MHRHTIVVLSLVLTLCLLPACDLVAPTDRYYNSAAHPPATGDLTTLGIMPGWELSGYVFFTFDSAYAPPQSGMQTMMDGNRLTSGMSWSHSIGFDTRGYPDGIHTLAVGLIKSGKGPGETGLLGYLGVPDFIFSGQIVLKQTFPFLLPVSPHGERPAVDPARNLLYVLEQDTVKAFSTLTNTLLRSRRVTGTLLYVTLSTLSHLGLSADGSRLYVYRGDGPGSCIVPLNSLTFDSLAAVPVTYPVGEIVSGDAGHLYVSSSTGLFFAPGASGILRVLDSGTLHEISELTLPLTAPMRMAVSNDRKTLFLASNGVCRVSVQSGIPTIELQRVTDQVTSVALSPDGLQLFLAINEGQYGRPYTGRVTVTSSSTLDSTGSVELYTFAMNVLDILPSGQDLFLASTVWTGSSGGRVERHSGLHAVTASWDFSVSPAPLQLSGDGHYLYANAGELCIPIP